MHVCTAKSGQKTSVYAAEIRTLVMDAKQRNKQLRLHERYIKNRDIIV
jgi:hypothetical protein